LNAVERSPRRTNHDQRSHIIQITPIIRRRKIRRAIKSTG
jgi:hypothetical protein